MILRFWIVVRGDVASIWIPFTDALKDGSINAGIANRTTAANNHGLDGSVNFFLSRWLFLEIAVIIRLVMSYQVRCFRFWGRASKAQTLYNIERSWSILGMLREIHR